MSRTIKDKPGYQRRIVSNKKLQVLSMRYGEDFRCRKKDRKLSRLIRNRLKVENRKEIRDYDSQRDV